MRIIIDAYNVLKPLGSTDEVSDGKREKFIKNIAEYARSTGNQVTVVFDGGGYVRPTRLKEHGIVVIYSGYRDTADDVIKKNIDDTVARSELIIVSTDRDICNYANEKRIVTMDSLVFYRYLHDHDYQSDRLHKKIKQTGLHKREGHESTSELDALMEEASSMMIPHSDREIEGENEKRCGKKLSKAERYLRKIAKKL